VVLVKAAMAVILEISFCAVCRVLSVMCIAVMALLLVCYRAFIHGLDGSVMAVDECLVDVV
jgi:coenzyme F420-reducing hydrogenase delta subunit